MTKNPLINGLSASVYIFLLVSLINYGMKTLKDSPETLLIPIVMISLFTLSAATMGFIFGYQPFQLYFDGKKKEAVKLFLQTIAVFGAITLLISLLVFSKLTI